MVMWGCFSALNTSLLPTSFDILNRAKNVITRGQREETKLQYLPGTGTVGMAFEKFSRGVFPISKILYSPSSKR